MKPNDENANLPIEQRPLRVLIISGSQRRQYNCPGIDSKSRTLMLKMAKALPADWEIDYEDLGNVFRRERIQSCNACVSTSMALCVWPCNCYSKNNTKEADLMWNLDLYSRLDMADAWAIIGPINWYAPSSNLKLMFDRLVCMNGGNPDETLINHKDPEKAIELERSELWKQLSQNHLEGRTAAFFCYGDLGGDELDSSGRPKLLRNKQYFDSEREPFENERDAYAPLVWQCRYGGIEVPDHLWRYEVIGKGKTYSESQAEHMINEYPFMATFEKWVTDFSTFVNAKGKIKASEYRAYGHIPPSHGWADIKDGIKYFRMMIGKPVADTSPATQQELNLNQDATWHPRKSEGDKLRNE